MLRTLDEKVDPRNAALVVIDVQNDFCHPDGAMAKNGASVAPMQAMVPRLNRLIESARRTGVPVIFVRVTHTAEDDSEVWLERNLNRKHYVCLDGSWGAEWYLVSPAEGEPVVVKHRYSAFTGTVLNELLRSKGVKSLILTGTTTDMCVESTARDGFMHDYYIVFVDDCAATSLPEDHGRTLERMTRTFGLIATADEIEGAWAKVQTVAPLARPS